MIKNARTAAGVASKFAGSGISHRLLLFQPTQLLGDYVVEDIFIQHFLATHELRDFDVVVFKDRYLYPPAHHGRCNVDRVGTVPFQKVVDFCLVEPPQYSEH
ncbi:MAG: hypothetical protein WA980_10950 [Shinella zoogloeoides]|uniref:hypothetical protein n=1 Tax=Shinella zoogloeoides TaxID=352475 RepID=UPI003C717FD5